jgi:hypothetical protein
MPEVLAINDFGRAFRGIEHKARPAIAPAKFTDRRDVGSKLITLAREERPGLGKLFLAGYEHEQQIKKLASHFNKDENYFTTILYNENMVLSEGLTNNENLSSFSSYEEAYHALINSLVNKQFTSSMLVLQNQPVERIFVDGGFSKNDVFMNVLATKFPNLQVYSTAIAQASALGAAMAIHWQPESSLTQFPIKRYESKRK